MTKLTTLIHHERDEQLFFTWLWCGYHSLIRQAHELTIDLDKRAKQDKSPFLAHHEAGRYLWRAITHLPTQADTDKGNETNTIVLARLAKKSPLFLVIYQGLWLEDRLIYAQQAASAALLYYVSHEVLRINHHSFMQLHSQLSQWIVDTIEAQHIDNTRVKAVFLFYFHDYTAKTTQEHRTLPRPPVITLLMNELMALYEDNQRNQPKMFGNFSNTAVQSISAICPNQQQHIFLMTCLDAIARVYVYAAYRNSMEQMLACERGTLLRFLAIPSLCGLALLASLFTHNTPVLLQLGLLYGLIRYVRFFVRSHAFDHYYNGGELVRYLQNWTPKHSTEGFLYWHQALHLDTAAFSIPEPEKITSAPPNNTPEYWYSGNYSRVIYHRLRILNTKLTPIIPYTIPKPASETLTWTINGLTYDKTHAVAIDQPNLPCNAPTAYFAAIHPAVAEHPDTEPFLLLLKGRLRFVGDAGAGVKMLNNHLFELKTVGSQGKNDLRMLSDPQTYAAHERTTARLLLFSQAPINHTQIKKHLSLTPLLR